MAFWYRMVAGHTPRCGLCDVTLAYVICAATLAVSPVNAEAHSQILVTPAERPEGAASHPPLVSDEKPSGTTLVTVNGTQLYESTYFLQYKAQNAEDMLRRLPGVPAILDAAGGTTQARGLGSGGDQILINGKRLATKNQIIQTIRRISAAMVARIELIRGTSSEIDVQSEGLIVNIVLKDGARNGRPSGNFELNHRFDDMGASALDGLISLSGTWGALEYVVGAERNAWSPLGTTPTGGTTDYSHRDRDEIYYYPDGSIQELRPQRWTRPHDKRIFTTNLSYGFRDGSQLRFNGRYQPHLIIETDNTPFTRFSTAGVATVQGVEYHRRRQHSRVVDLGGEYERRIGPGSLNLIALHTRTRVKVADFRNRTFATGLFTEVSRSAIRTDSGEDVLRSTYSFPLAKGQDVTLGAEGARNTLVQDLAVFFDFNRDGVLEPVVSPIALASVKELRGEAFITHNWKIDANLTLESRLSMEASRISTNYPAIPQMSYRFLKPRIDLRYNATPLDRLRFKIERTISQLDFNNFIPLYNVTDDRIDAGNPQIQPEKTWIFELSGEHRLHGDNGQVELRGFYNSITDVIDRGPFGVAANGLPFSAPVNISHGRALGFELKWGVRLALLGWRNVQVNGRYLRQFTQVEDPFTNRERKLKAPWDGEFNVGIRHDLTKAGLSYGANYVDTSGGQISSDIRNYEYFSRSGRFDMFIEKALPHRLSLRLEGWNLTGSREQRTRSLYTVSQAQGNLLRTESYREKRDRRFAVRLRGQF